MTVHDPATATAAAPARRLLHDYQTVRRATIDLCRTLRTEDYVVQSMPDVSPTKWHLAHTSWFFETFLLVPRLSGYAVFDPHYAYLFNSYYVAVGDRHCRQNRGQLSRPGVDEVFAYRHHVDQAMERLLLDLDDRRAAELRPLVGLGLNHEQQHQELMLTDIKHVFWVNPLRPAFRDPPTRDATAAPPMRWIRFEEGLRHIGHENDAFHFDNESPRHRVFLNAYELASRLVTNGEYIRFIDDGGYDRPDLWLSLGFATARQEQWDAPNYWIRQDGRWHHHTLAGLRPVDPAEPVCHVSFFEADAFARWAGARLPTEAEWEAAAETLPIHGNFQDDAVFHPTPAPDAPGLQQMFGDAWEWTRSAYEPYPGYQPPPGALGEYNGKFMCNQYVLRGGSCATPRSHVRRTYRNFFPPDARWQFMGFRLARNV